MQEVGENGNEDDDDDVDDDDDDDTTNGNTKSKHPEVLVAPMSVQPTRKNKSSTLSMAALRRI